MTCHVQGCGRRGIAYVTFGNVSLIVCRNCSEYARPLGVVKILRHGVRPPEDFVGG